MATIDRTATERRDDGLLDPEGFPWLENGERMDREMFLDRYEKTPEHFRAELIEGIVYVMTSPLKNRHGRSDNHLSGCIFVYTAATAGTMGQDNTTTVLGEKSIPQPDSALLILSEYGGQSRDGDDDFTYGAPELLVEVAHSSRSIDLFAKFRDYERAEVQEYIIFELRRRILHWFELRDGRFVPLPADSDGLFRSRVFPGLWLDPVALVARDPAALMATMQRGLASPEHAAFVAELERRRAERAGGA
jgi:Uma2 family endonuclease